MEDGPVGANRFVPRRSIGDLGDTEISFYPGNPEEPDSMVAAVTGSYHVICPRYQAGSWTNQVEARISGTYSVNLRHPSVHGDSSSTVNTSVENGIMRMGEDTVLMPISESEIRIVGGVFTGEMIRRDITTGALTWQDVFMSPQ